VTTTQLTRIFFLGILLAVSSTANAFVDDYCGDGFTDTNYNGSYTRIGSSPDHWENVDTGYFLWTQSGAQGFISDTDLGYPTGYPTSNYAWNFDPQGDVVKGNYKEEAGGVTGGSIVEGACAGGGGGGGGTATTTSSDNTTGLILLSVAMWGIMGGAMFAWLRIFILATSSR